MQKTYQTIDKQTSRKAFMLSVNGKSKMVEFEDRRRNGILLFETSDKNIIGALETSKFFKEKTVTLLKTVEDEETENDTSKEVEEHPAITNIQQAKEMLRGAPYNIPHQALMKPENVLAKAKELGLSFPNLEVN